MTTLYTPEYLHVLRTAYADGKAPARVELLHMLDHVDTLTKRLEAVRELVDEFEAEDIMPVGQVTLIRAAINGD